VRGRRGGREERVFGGEDVLADADPYRLVAAGGMDDSPYGQLVRCSMNRVTSSGAADRPRAEKSKISVPPTSAPVVRVMILGDG
jgi:hypothetical protein